MLAVCDITGTAGSAIRVTVAAFRPTCATAFVPPPACRVPLPRGMPSNGGVSWPDWNRGVGPRADPAQLVPRMGYKGSGHLPLPTDHAVLVAHLLCRLRPVVQHSCRLRPVVQHSCRLRLVARPSWPGLARRPARSAVRVRIQPPTVMSVHDGCPSAILFTSTVLACSGLTAVLPAAATMRSRTDHPPFHFDARSPARASALFASADLGYSRVLMVRRRPCVVDGHHGVIEPARQHIPTGHRCARV